MNTRKKEAIAGFLFASPWIFGFTIFLGFPLLASIYYSFCDYSVLRKPVFIGLENYTNLINDELFWKSLSNTFIYAFFAIPTGVVVSITVALLLNAKVKGMSIYRTIFYLPSLVPMITMAMIWMWMFNGERGIVNILLLKIGIPGPDWLGSTLWSKPALALMSLWGVGNAVVIYLAGLQDVPPSLYEASELDGATSWEKTRFVTLPMISPVIQFNLIMSIIGTLQVFAIPYVMFPGGAPARSTYFYTMYLFDNAFVFHKMGYASAMGWIMFVIIFLLTMGAMKLTDKSVTYPGA